MGRVCEAAVVLTTKRPLDFSGGRKFGAVIFCSKICTAKSTAFGGKGGDNELFLPLRGCFAAFNEEKEMRGIIAWLLGVPIFVIILLYFFNVF